MKRLYFYLVAGIILVALIAFWVYSFLYGTPGQRNVVFTNLGIFGGEEEIIIDTPPNLPIGEPVVDVAPAPLRQLTTKPVVGMRLLERGTTSIMRYVEAGTGHIFDIDMQSGQEVRVSQISVPVASEAALSPSGDYVAIRSGYNNQNELVVVDLTNPTTPTSLLLPNQVESFTFAYNNELLFTEFVQGQTEGKGYLPSTKGTRRLFTIPFTAIAMAWNTASTGNHIAYTKPATSMAGYAYRIGVTGATRLPYTGYALTLSQSGGKIFIGEAVNNRYDTIVVNKNGVSSRVPSVFLPEKCVGSERREKQAYCTSPFEPPQSNLPNDWYKGRINFNDAIWSIDTEGSATLLANPLSELGRSLDIVKLQLSPNERMLYFLNKIDQTLWVYEI